jgi:hypothetical protein
MTTVTAQMSVSVDGFYAGPKHTDMQTWLESPEAAETCCCPLSTAT